MVPLELLFPWHNIVFMMRGLRTTDSQHLRFKSNNSLSNNFVSHFLFNKTMKTLEGKLFTFYVIFLGAIKTLFWPHESRHSLRCSHIQKNQTSSPTGWLRMRVWRMSLRRTKSAVISWAGSFNLYWSVSELRETFNLFDRDNDGYLTAKELGEALRAMAQHPTEQEVKDLAKRATSEGEQSML